MQPRPMSDAPQAQTRITFSAADTLSLAPLCDRPHPRGPFFTRRVPPGALKTRRRCAMAYRTQLHCPQHQ